MAVYGGNPHTPDDPNAPRKITWSVVSGKTKDDLKVDQNIGVVTHTLHPAQERIRIATAEFLHLVKSVVEMQSKSGVNKAVPVVYGSTVEILSQDLVDELVRSYADRLGKVAVIADPTFMRSLINKTPGTSVPHIYKELFKIVLQTLMGTVTPPGALDYQIRDYACANGSQDWDVPAGATLLHTNNTAERTRLANSVIPRDLRKDFDATYEAFLNRRDDVRIHLEQLTQQIAFIYAGHSLLSKDDHGNTVNRFISAATTKDLTPDSDVRNFIFLDAGLRKVYAEAFMAYHHIRHNVCFKTSLDAPSPPFADIAGTFLADQFDERDGTRPTAVLVR